MIRLSVVIPVFNEQHRIEPLLKTVDAATRSWRSAREIIVVDDGSTDGTGAALAAAARDGIPITVLCHERNRGKGAALRRGVLASHGALVLLTDADLATPIGELRVLLARIAEGADVAIGSRGVRGSRILVPQSRFRQWSGHVFNRIVRLILLPDIADTQCGFKLFRGPAARALFARSVIDGYTIDVEILRLAAAAGLTIAEVPVTWSHMEGSKVRVLRDGVRMGRELLGIWNRLGMRARVRPELTLHPGRVLPR